MEVNLPPELEQRLSALADQSGRTTGELVRDAFVGMFDELAEVRQRLDHRYDELEQGLVEPIPGDAVEEHFRRKAEAALNRIAAAQDLSRDTRDIITRTLA